MTDIYVKLQGRSHYNRHSVTANKCDMTACLDKYLCSDVGKALSLIVLESLESSINYY